MEYRSTPHIGLIRRATITRVNPGQSTIRVSLDLSSSDIGPPIEYNVPIPAIWTGTAGQFVGGCPKVGASVIVAQAQGGEWFILNYIPSNKVFLNDTTADTSGTTLNLMSVLKEDRWVAQTRNNVRIFGDPEIGIQVGGPNKFLHINPNKKIISHNIDQQLSFTEGSRVINGPIKRDLVHNATKTITGSMLDSQEYDDSLFTISLDPTAVSSAATSGSFVRNPALTENHKITYEFANSFNFTDDIDEADRYETKKNNQDSNLVKRRDSRADSLSLSLVAPNYLIESTEGTVVDVYGNILDLNRNALPIGKINDISLRVNPNKSDAFKKIREQMRKSIAFHFEINTRKSVSIPDVSSTEDYARNRSRFFIDIDKEGQLKINIPSSSEVGNIPLLTRYENFSTLYANENNTNPNEFVRNVNKIDVFAENFATTPKIQLMSGSSILDGYSSVIDRVTDNPIMLGTAYHDILSTIDARVRVNPTLPYDANNLLNKLPTYSRSVVSDKIIVSGPNANAGGRSGTINLDGMLSVNIGANTIDRQSMWFDYAGGVVGNIGRDRNNISYAVNMDGDMIIQVGGRSTVSNDSRFKNLNNAVRSGSIDIRVVKDDGQLTIVRIDSAGGVTIATPGRVDISAAQSIRIKSKADLLLDAENIVMYANETGRGRVVNRTGQSI